MYPPTPRLRAPPRRPCLRLATLNVAGRLTANTTAVAHLAVDHDVDVLALQEVKLGGREISGFVHRLNSAAAARAVERRRQHTGFCFKASPNVAAVRSAGVVTLLRKALIDSGDLEMQGDAQTDFDWGGRMLSSTVAWRGHTLQILNIYCPNEPESRVAFINSTIATAWQQRPQGTIMMGDWNFVPDPVHDRRSSGGQPSATARDSTSLSALRAAAPGAVDAWRFKHPGSKNYTFFSAANGHAARHDRIYGSVALVPHVLSCRSVPAAFSDHDLVLTDVLPRLPPAARGRGIPRARLDFTASEQHSAEFRTWLSGEMRGAPASDLSLLAWWPHLKHRIRQQVLQLNRAWRAACPPLDSASLVHEVETAVARLGAAHTQQQTTTAMQGVLAARAALRRHQQQHCAACDRLQRLRWVHRGERPQPAITEHIRALQGGRSNKLITLVDPSGRPMCERAAPANVAIAHYARVSQQPVVDAAAKAEVLAAVRALQPQEGEAADGSHQFEEGEVAAAMASSRPGTAPGPDGLPLVFYKKFKDLVLPVLVRVFAAIGATGSVPRRFLDGAIVAILKPGGNPLETVGYRPITLLNTDYRLLARVLADRLQPALSKVVSPSQTAFLKGRRSGANILTLQLLAEGLPADSEMVAALLDFSKAYDTIDRDFLLEVMKEMGVGDEFCTWVQILLTATRARTVINGYASDPHLFEAGVRQGCPLSPLLYLCVAEALLRFLQQKRVGATVMGVGLTSTQFADDTQVYLPSVRDVPAFLQMMDRFAAASGQHLNIGKTKILLLGRRGIQQHAQQQQQQHDVQQQQQHPQVVTTATVLGVTIGADAGSVFAERSQGVLAALGRLAHLRHLSVFGRGLASAAYGVSKLLYAAEFSDLPSAAECTRLSKAVSKLVDRGLAPDSQEHKFPGVKAELLKGSPAGGGFGVLPWLEHIRARHAWWGAKFVSAPADTAEPWILLGRAMLRSLNARCGPMACLDFPDISRAPAPLKRMVAGLQALGRVRVVCPPAPPEFVVSSFPDVVVAPGAWCADAPLWSNPFAPAPQVPTRPGPQGLQVLPTGRLQGAMSGGGLGRPLLLTVGDAVRALRVVAVRARGDPYTGPWADAGSEEVDLNSILSSLPAGWHAAASAATPPTPGPLEAYLQSDGLSARGFSRAPSARELLVECGLVTGLGWRLGATSVRCASLSVKQATAMQLRPLYELRRRYHRDFVDSVNPALVRGDPDASSICCKALAVGQGQLWRLKWDNTFKEVYWRLVVNGLATAERMHLQHCRCVCGSVAGGPPGRRHHFWDCPVAQAVVEEMQRQLVGWFPAVLQPQHVLCMVCPVAVGGQGAPAMHKGVWRVVCLAAINAMDVGRRAANTLVVQQRQQAALEAAQQQLPGAPVDQQRITDLLQLAPLTAHQQQHHAAVQQRQQLAAQQREQQEQQAAVARLAEVKQKAVSRFWELLQDFVALEAAPRAWLPLIAPNHPFLRVTGTVLSAHSVDADPGVG